MVDAKVLGENIRLLRKSAGLQVNEFAIQLDIGFAYLSQIELGNRNPSVSLIIKIANFFCVSIDELSTERNLVSQNNIGYRRKIYMLLNRYPESSHDYLFALAKRVSKI